MISKEQQQIIKQIINNAKNVLKFASSEDKFDSALSSMPEHCKEVGNRKFDISFYYAEQVNARSEVNYYNKLLKIYLMGLKQTLLSAKKPVKIEATKTKLAIAKKLLKACDKTSKVLEKHLDLDVYPIDEKYAKEFPDKYRQLLFTADLKKLSECFKTSIELGNRALVVPTGIEIVDIHPLGSKLNNELDQIINNSQATLVANKNKSNKAEKDLQSDLEEVETK